MRRFRCSVWNWLAIFKRNGKALWLNAIVDVRRRRRHEMIFFNISETITASDFKINHEVALDSLYISTGNDVIISGRK